MSTAEDGQRAGASLRPGARVEVRNAFDGTWSRGFTVLAIEGDRVRLQRRSDHTELPATFGTDEVREERRRSLWWV
jgi:hypothetical protein